MQLNRKVHVRGWDRPVAVEATDHADGHDTSITSLRVSWTHSIFATHEEVRFTLVASANGDDFLVHADGRIEAFTPETDENHAALGRALAELV